MSEDARLDPTYLVTRLRDELARGEAELGIAVEVIHDSVFLTGIVPSEERRVRAEAAARRISVGYIVVNEISLCPPMAPGDPEVLR
jgi:osmotically-inducible protein OsmY